jgi:hypothetical protein
MDSLIRDSTRASINTQAQGRTIGERVEETGKNCRLLQPVAGVNPSRGCKQKM